VQLIDNNPPLAEQSIMHWRGKAAGQAANNALHQRLAERGLLRLRSTKKHSHLERLLSISGQRDNG
jgi:hypothetical protein